MHLHYMENISADSLRHITKTLPEASTSPWFRNLSKLLKEINPTSHDVVTTLVLLSASVTDGNALPPYLQAPAYFDISKKLMAMDSGRLQDGKFQGLADKIQKYFR
jgi:hypothetical protein